ncbi:MAG: hypothetical protein WBX25_09515 [Rhodomicrobium sp.]
MELLRFMTFKDERGYELALRPVASKQVEGTILAGVENLSVMARGGQKIPLVLQGSKTCIFEKIANTPRTPEGALDLVSEWGFLSLADDEMPVQSIINQIIELRCAMELAASHRLNEIESLFPQKEAAKLDVIFERFGRDRAPRLYLKPKSLIHFAWIELLCTISGNAGFRKCTCGNVFTYGLEKGSRNSRLYCSNRCRVANHRTLRRNVSK